MTTAQLKIIEIVRIKKSRPSCEKIVQEPAPSRTIPRSTAGSSLLTYILTSKFDDHVPLYCQHEISERMGAGIPDTTLVDWCGAAVTTLNPLIERIEAKRSRQPCRVGSRAPPCVGISPIGRSKI